MKTVKRMAGHMPQARAKMAPIAGRLRPAAVHVGVPLACPMTPYAALVPGIRNLLGKT